MEIRTLDGPGDAAWDEYVRLHPDGTLFHESAWTRSVVEAYGHPPVLLGAFDGGRLVGGLPMSEIRSRIFGRRLVSCAFSVYGGILADDPNVATALAAAARNVARGRRAAHVELKSRRAALEGVPGKDLYFSFRLPIAPTFESTLKAFTKKMRQDLRRSETLPFTTVESGVDTPTFHSLYLHTLRAHGTPPFPRQWFETLRRNLGDRCVMLGIGSGGRFVGASMIFHDRERGTLMPYYTGVPREFYKLRTIPALHARMVRMAIDRRCTVLDLGRSKRGTGAFDAKTHWGIEPEPLGYQYLLPPGAKMPDLSPSNPRLKFLVEIWKRLPIAATRVLGPPLNASLA